MSHDAHTLGRRAFLAGTAGAVAGATLLSGSAHAVEPGASFFQVVEQRRLCDTRNRPGAPGGYGYQRLGDRWIRVGVTNQPGVPGDAIAAVLSVTAVSVGAGANFVTVFPSGEPVPDTSSQNLSPSDGAVANLVTIKLGSGAVDLTSYVRCDLIVDLIGVYRPTTSAVSAGRLVAFPSAVRTLDTRSGPQPGVGSISRVNLNGLVPADATAVVGTLTAVTAGVAGFVTAYPRGSAVPDTSNLNVGVGETRAVGVITKLGFQDGISGVDLYNFCGSHLLFDLVGYMTGPSSAASATGLFVPITPTRMLDTRREKMRVWHGSTKQFTLPAPINTRAQAIAMNLTVTSTVDAGFFTLYAAQTPRREVSNLNVTASGQTIANHAICRISTAGVACYGYGAAHMICDVMGWYTGTPERAVYAPPVNPPPPGGAIPWIVTIPRLGLVHGVYDGDAKRTVDGGNTWHWAGTGLVGQGANSVLFGHRTEYGGPYRNQHLIQPGDELHILTSDSRRYTYRMVAEYITSKYANDILSATRRVGGETLSLVSCSKTNRLPTSLEYRLIT
ncbi:MAG TPA: sortase, partial [Ilumatobacteraceae bacterium]|nr:sortase [Ilumatobacteraceae bacterium]